MIRTYLSRRLDVQQKKSVKTLLTFTSTLFSRGLGSYRKTMAAVFGVVKLLDDLGYPEVEQVKKALPSQGHVESAARENISRLIKLPFQLFNIIILSPLLAPIKSLLRLLKRALKYIQSHIYKAFQRVRVSTKNAIQFGLKPLIVWFSLKLQGQIIAGVVVNVMREMLLTRGDIGAAYRIARMINPLRSLMNLQDAKTVDLFNVLTPFLQDKKQQILESKETNFTAKGNKTLFVSLVLWGKEYRHLFLNYCLPSIMATKNLGSGSEWSPVWHILMPDDEKAVFLAEMSKCTLALPGEVVWDTFPRKLINNADGDLKYWLFGGLSQLTLVLAERHKSFVHFLNPDTIYSSEFFSNLNAMITENSFKIVLSNSFRTQINEVLPKLEPFKKLGNIEISSKDLTSLAINNMHPLYSLCIMPDEGFATNEYPPIPVVLRKTRSATYLHTLHHQPILIDCDLPKGINYNWFTIDSSVDRIIDDQNLEGQSHVLTGKEQITYIEMSDPESFDAPAIESVAFLERFAANTTENNIVNFNKGIEFKTPNSFVTDKISKSERSWSKAFCRVTTDLTEAVVMRESQRIADGFSGLEINSMDKAYRHSEDLLLYLKKQSPEKLKKVMEKFEEDVGPFIRTTIKNNTRHDEEAVLNTIYNLLRLGRLDLVELILEGWDFEKYTTEAGVIQKFDPDIVDQGVATKNVLQFAIKLIANAEADALDIKRLVAKKKGARDAVVFSALLWGEDFARNYVEFTLSSLMAEGNLPYVAKAKTLYFRFICDESARRILEKSQHVKSLQKICHVHFWNIPKEVVMDLSAPSVRHRFYQLYGTIDHVFVHFAEKLECALFMIPVDCIANKDSLKNMMLEGSKSSHIVGSGNIVANTETFLPAISGLKDSNNILSIETSQLASIAINNAHQYFKSQLLTSKNTKFGAHAREIFAVENDSIQIRSVFIHPLFISKSGISKYVNKHYANVDYGLVPRIVGAVDDISVENIQGIYINNYCEKSRKYELTDDTFSSAYFWSLHLDAHVVQRALLSKVQKLKTSNTHPFVKTHEFDLKSKAEVQTLLLLLDKS